MEEKLRKLFDYQRFEHNPRLERIINAAEASATALSDEDMFYVAAAGAPVPPDIETPDGKTATP